jgi:hypothetical protein
MVGDQISDGLPKTICVDGLERPVVEARYQRLKYALTIFSRELRDLI